MSECKIMLFSGFMKPSNYVLFSIFFYFTTTVQALVFHLFWHLHHIFLFFSYR
jgi:hypothetical protein